MKLLLCEFVFRCKFKETFVNLSHVLEIGSFVDIDCIQMRRRIPMGTFPLSSLIFPTR